MATCDRADWATQLEGRGALEVADRFMVAIEVITSKTKTIHIKNESGSLEAVQVQIWNATISNLTLMALGALAD